MITVLMTGSAVRAAICGAVVAGPVQRRLTGTEAREMADQGLLRCEDPHCAAKVFYRQGPGRPHWAHTPGTAVECAATVGGGPGEFHNYLQFDVLGGAFAHEFSVPGARADAIVQRIGSKKNVALEVQHSPIAAETVLARHAAHQAASIMGTVWIINSADVARRPGGIITTSWVVDLIEACQGTPGGYACTVVIYKDRRHLGAGETLRVVDRAEIGHDADGRRIATVEFSEGTISVEALRLFAAGKDRPREIPAELEAGVRALDAAPTRRVKKIVPAWQPARAA